MSVEDRLRSGMHAEADAWAPEVESSLARVRARRRRGRRAALAGGVAALLAALAVGVGVAGQGSIVGVPAASASVSAEPLVGRFEGDVVSPARLAGRWVLQFRTDGRLDIEAPSRYRGVLSAVLFRTEADTLATTLFQEDVCSGIGVGRYTWTRTASGVRFTELDDRCSDRQEFLAETTWTSTR